MNACAATPGLFDRSILGHPGKYSFCIGEAEAEVIRQKIDSMESGNYAIVQVAQALAGAGVQLVPEVLVGGGHSAGQGGTLVDVLLAGLVKDRLARPEPAPVEVAAT